uniref:Uncharacterized protein n=1 Tax=Micrurus lemniscatus lemniscatus TaxID=129467 RepID=A0A2D4JIW1_MICLE
MAQATRLSLSLSDSSIPSFPLELSGCLDAGPDSHTSSSSDSAAGHNRFMYIGVPNLWAYYRSVAYLQQGCMSGQLHSPTRMNKWVLAHAHTCPSDKTMPPHCGPPTQKGWENSDVMDGN